MPDRYGRMDWRDRDREWRDRETRRDYRDDHEGRRASHDDPMEDYGQADYSRDYAYDPANRTGYRVDPREEARQRRDDGLRSAERENVDRDYLLDRGRGHRQQEDLRDHHHRGTEAYSRERDHEDRSWGGRGGKSSLFGGRDHRGENDRVLWVVATEALRKARGIDQSDIDVQVENGVITLNGTVRSREEKRRAEDLVEQRGVRDVQNNLRIRERRFF